MATRREKRGSGMTEREIVFDSPDALRETLEAAKSGPVVPLERWALDTLKKVGIESDHEERASGEQAVGWRGVVKLHRYEDDSPEGYAAKILECVHYIRLGLKNGDIDQVGLFSFELGACAKEAAMKFEFEPTWETGLKIKLAARRGGPKSGLNNDRDRELAEKFLERQGKSGMSDSKIKADLGKVEGLSRSAAIDAVNRGLKLLSG